MADLDELYKALDAIKQNSKSAKLYFYFTSNTDSQMHSGFFSISQGESCAIHYLDKSTSDALGEIPQLHLTKVMSLPATQMDLSNEPSGVCSMDEVLDRLNPENFVVVAPAPAPVFEPAPAGAQPEPHKTHVFYSHVAMQQDVTQLLEKLYGSGAAKKVEEIAFASPPHQFPVDFVDKCKQHASMMLGAKKADELFKPIYDKLA
ncbi:MAG: hypothetical protein ACREO1_10500 [Arenimonas sp.]